MPISKTLAKNEREWRALLRSKDRNVVRTMSDWKKLLKSKESPLSGIDPKAVAAFTKTLKFKNGGFAHADYGPIVDLVPYSKFREIFQRFGMDMSLFADYDNYSCESKGTCKPTSNYICTSNC